MEDGLIVQELYLHLLFIFKLFPVTIRLSFWNNKSLTPHKYGYNL